MAGTVLRDIMAWGYIDRSGRFWACGCEAAARESAKRIGVEAVPAFTHPEDAREWATRRTDTEGGEDE